jgi:cytochrome c553
MTRKIIWGMGVQAASGELKDITQTAENQAKRNEMIKVCVTCHSDTRRAGISSPRTRTSLLGTRW